MGIYEGLERVRYSLNIGGKHVVQAVVIRMFTRPMLRSASFVFVDRKVPDRKLDKGSGLHKDKVNQQDHKQERITRSVIVRRAVQNGLYYFIGKNINKKRFHVL